MRALLTAAALLLALGGLSLTSAGCCGCRHRHAEPDEEDEQKTTSLLVRTPVG